MFMNFIRLEYLDVVAKKMLLLILCIALCGCQPPYDGTSEEPNESWTKWTDGQLVSIVDDSLAVLKICKYYKKIWYEWGFSGSQEYYEIIDSRTGLFIVNYRNKQKPLLGDTLSYDLRVVDDYYKDSSVLVFDEKNSQFGFWKIGTKSIKFFEKYNDSSHSDVSFKARPWINGNILFSNSKPINQALILNIETGQIEPFEFSGEYEWLSECSDVSYIGNKIACIRRNNEIDNFELVVNNIITDTLAYEYSLWHGISNWYGNYIKDSRYGGDGDFSTGEISKIDMKNFKFDDAFGPMKVKNTRLNNSDQRYSTFQDSSNFIMYYLKDLIGVNN